VSCRTSPRLLADGRVLLRLDFFICRCGTLKLEDEVEHSDHDCEADEEYDDYRPDKRLCHGYVLLVIQYDEGSREKFSCCAAVGVERLQSDLGWLDYKSRYGLWVMGYAREPNPLAFPHVEYAGGVRHVNRYPNRPARCDVPRRLRNGQNDPGVRPGGAGQSPGRAHAPSRQMPDLAP
jgi:hypothetical protein